MFNICLVASIPVTLCVCAAVIEADSCDEDHEMKKRDMEQFGDDDSGLMTVWKLACTAPPTCAHGVLHVSLVKLALSQQEVVVGLGAAPGVVHDAAVRGRSVLLQQPGQREGRLKVAADAVSGSRRWLADQHKGKVQDDCVPPTSSPWLCSAATSSPARGSSPPGEPPARRASSPAAACSSSPPPRQQSATKRPTITAVFPACALWGRGRTWQHTHLEHELGCVQEVVGLPVELHRLQSFLLLQQVRGVLGEQGFDLLHVVGPGELHRFVPLGWIRVHMRENRELVPLRCRNTGSSIDAESSSLDSHLVEVDAGVHRCFGLVALQVGLHRLLTHAHGGKHLSDLLQTHADGENFNIFNGRPSCRRGVGLTGSSLWFSGSSAVSLSRPS